MSVKNTKESKGTLEITKNISALHENMNFTATEQYKLLRANLSFALSEEKKCFVIGVTSAVRGEGKSTTAINTAYVLAEAGKKVLLVDGDLRIPSIAKKMEMSQTPGLTNMLLSGDYSSVERNKFKDLEQWNIIPAGDLPPNPSELLGSKKMRSLLDAMAEKFEYIIIDLPPVNIVSDALAISSMLDGMLLVIRENYTSKKDLDRCVNQLKLSNVKVLGCVMNVIKSEKKRYGKYAYYGKYYNKKHKDNVYGYGEKKTRGKNK